MLQSRSQKGRPSVFNSLAELAGGGSQNLPCGGKSSMATIDRALVSIAAGACVAWCEDGEMGARPETIAGEVRVPAPDRRDGRLEALGDRTQRIARLDLVT